MSRRADLRSDWKLIGLRKAERFLLALNRKRFGHEVLTVERSVRTSAGAVNVPPAPNRCHGDVWCARPSRRVDRTVCSFDQAFQVLFDLARTSASKVAPAEAEDVAAETMRRAHDRWDLIEPYVRAWVVRVARNLAIDRLRTKSPSAAAPEPLLFESDVTERVALYAVLRTLPDRQRDAIALRYLVDLSLEDVASAMGVSVGTVKQHIHRGLAALRSKGDLDG